MAISSVSSQSPVQAPPKAPPVEAAAPAKDGKDSKPKVDANTVVAANAAAKSSEPKPVTNTMGQVTGRTLNVTA